MTSREFCYWLQGFFEVRDANRSPSEPYTVVSGLTHEQTNCVKQHLAMVFANEIDPSYPEQDKLNAIHSGGGIAKPATTETRHRC